MTPRERFRAGLDAVLTFRAGNGGEVCDGDLDAIVLLADEYAAGLAEQIARPPYGRPERRLRPVDGAS